MTTTKEEIVNGDEVFYVERHSVAEGTFGFSDLKSMVLLAAKLRNKAVFFTRQHFFNKTGRDFQYDMFEHIESKYVSYNTLYRYLYDTTDFNFFALPSTVAQEVLRNVNNEWSSYKELLAKKKRGEYDGKINIPGYSDTQNGTTYSITFYKKNLSKNSLKNGIVNKVVFVPIGDFYSKKGLIQASKRLKMLKLAVQNEKNIEIDDFETSVQTTLFAKDAFKIISEKYKNDEPYFIMGSDNFVKMSNWEGYDEIIELYKYIVISRN